MGTCVTRWKEFSDDLFPHLIYRSFEQPDIETFSAKI